MRRHTLFLTILCLVYPLFGAPSKKPSAKVQKRLAAERAKVRAAIKRDFQKKKAPAKKRPRQALRPQKKRAQKKAPVRKKKAPPKKRVPQRKRAHQAKEKTPQQRLRELRRTINNLVHEADKTASVGVKVVLLKNKSTVYQKNANQLFKPASNTKLITAAAAYHILGPQYRFSTKLYADKKNGSSINNLYIKGSGDPTLSEKDLTALVKKLKSQGIKEVRGDIIVDASIFNSQGTGPGWRTGDGAIYDKAPTAGLMVNHSCIRVRVKPSRTVGKRPLVYLDPHTPFSRIKNTAVTRAQSKGNKLHVLRGANNTIIVRGSISKRSKQKRYRIAIKNPARFAGQVLAGVLRKQGILCRNKVKIGTVPKSARLLATHTSRTLSSMMRFMMKASDNLYADAMFRAMGAHVYGTPGTWTKGKRAVEAFLRNKVGINTTELKINDGSGLSHRNQISPNHLIKLLTWVYTKSPHKESFIASLPIGGVDGTLRNRMKHRSTKAAVKAKTGSLSGVTSLSGYITPKTGLPLIFVIMVNRKHKSAVIFKRKLEDQLCKLLAAHAFSTS